MAERQLPAPPALLHVQDAIDRAITAAVGGSQAAIAGWNITRFIPFNPVDKKTVAEVGRWMGGGRLGEATLSAQMLGCWPAMPASQLPVSPRLSVPQVVAPDGRQLSTAKGAPQIIRDLLADQQARALVDR